MSTFGLLFGLVEVVVVVFLVVRLRRVVRRVRASRAILVDALDEALAAELPAGLGRVLATEAAVFAYAATGWRHPTPTEGFSTHRERSYFVIAGVIGFLLLVETLGLHVILSHVSVVAAWIVTALSIYSLVWIVGDTQAVRLHPLRLTPDGLVIVQGLRWRTEVPWQILDAAEPIDAAPAGVRRLGPIGANVLLRLRAPVDLRGPFGLHRRADRLALTVDGRESFLAAVSRLAETPRQDPQPSLAV